MDCFSLVTFFYLFNFKLVRVIIILRCCVRKRQVYEKMIFCHTLTNRFQVKVKYKIWLYLHHTLIALPLPFDLNNQTRLRNADP